MLTCLTVFLRVFRAFDYLFTMFGMFLVCSVRFCNLKLRTVKQRKVFIEAHTDYMLLQGLRDTIAARENETTATVSISINSPVSINKSSFSQ